MDSSNTTQVRHQGAEPHGINHPYSASQTSSNPHDPNTNPYPFNLKRFYNMHEGPWVPFVSGPQTSQQMQGVSNYNPNSPAFQHFRSRGLPSECDTCPDDSGYGGSRAPYSVENTSVYEGDSNPEAHNTAVLMEGFHLCPSMPTSHITWSQSQPPSISNALSNGENKHRCGQCESSFRTRSELNKHNLRHNKPFCCDVPGCIRKEGFGTKNDLYRHKRSVHPDLTVSGSRYICSFDQCANRRPLKIWPRADNFRSHLRRIHHKELSADADLEAYIYRDAQISTQDSGRDVSVLVPNQPALREDLQGVGGMSYIITNPSTDIQRPVDNSFSPSYLGNQPMDTESGQDIREDLETLLQDATSSQKAQSSRDSPHTFQNFAQSSDSSNGSLQSSQPPNGRMMSLPAARFRYSNRCDGDVKDRSSISATNRGSGPIDAVAESAEHENECDGPPETDIARPAEQPEATATTAKPKETDQDSDVPSALDLLGLVRSGTNNDKVLEFLRQFPKDLLDRALNDGTDDGKLSASNQESTIQKNQFPCTECNKTFNRQCELKKHLKRHEKPYGCTFRGCSKAFGSKNDWKRHESSQHWQLETWKCEEIKPGQTGACGKVCQRRESFKYHLSKDHSITDGKQVDEKFEKCRIGRHCDTRFWCGFCEKIVEITEEGVNAWTKRCDHIDDHFCGRNGPKRRICRWKSIANDDEKMDKDQAGSSTAVSSKPSSLSPDSSPSYSPSTRSGLSTSLKRRKSAPGDSARYKKQRQEQIYMWNCCDCATDNNCKLSPRCVRCDHERCNGCTYGTVAQEEEKAAKV